MTHNPDYGGPSIQVSNCHVSHLGKGNGKYSMFVCVQVCVRVIGDIQAKLNQEASVDSARTYSTFVFLVLLKSRLIAFRLHLNSVLLCF